jgi:2-polyprenyl-3-methyl-5-hydroxy-6-metoxy-1,4-benzoquinol methylase
MTAVAGNLYDKYGARSPVVRGLMARFTAALDDLIAVAAPRSLLDVGCGEGVLTQRWARQLAPARVVGVDRARLAWGGAPNLEYRVASAGELPFAAGEFGTVAAIEVLEHVDDPERALAEMARVARGGHLLVSVPREPLWRALNLARGAYVRDLGNTPGHVHHWSRRAFGRLLARHGDVVQARSPLPWTMLLVRV